MKRVLFSMLCLPMAGAVFAAGGHAMPRHVIAGGGGSAAGGGYVLHGTVAQAVAGTSGQGALELTHGYWRPRVSAPAGPAIFRDGFETR